VQSDLLNKQGHPSTIVCPITTSVQPRANILRVHMPKGASNIFSASDIMIDQVRAIDNSRLIKKLGFCPKDQIEKVRENLSKILDMED
jgi:mRNA interferase MazF